MDRDEPLGNSLDVFLRRALHVKVGNTSTEAIPVYSSELGTPKYFDIQNTTSPGIEKIIFSYLLIKDLKLTKVAISCRQESTAYIKADGNTIASLRLGAARPTDSFSWEPTRLITMGANIQITIKARAQSPIVDVEAYLMCLEQT